jgi:hypothetical protein
VSSHFSEVCNIDKILIIEWRIKFLVGALSGTPKVIRCNIPGSGLELGLGLEKTRKGNKHEKTEGIRKEDGKE